MCYDIQITIKDKARFTPGFIFLEKRRTEMEDRNFRLLGFFIVGFFILYLIMAGMMADQQDQIKELQYKIEAQQKLLDYHNDVLVNINRKVQFPGG
jgi:hypothetical protein